MPTCRGQVEPLPTCIKRRLALTPLVGGKIFDDTPCLKRLRQRYVVNILLEDGSSRFESDSRPLQYRSHSKVKLAR
jgi:hypothetical protein